jgi:hypothetical protein
LAAADIESSDHLLWLLQKDAAPARNHWVAEDLLNVRPIRDQIEKARPAAGRNAEGEVA